MPTKNSRIATLIRIGFLPTQAVALVEADTQVIVTTDAALDESVVFTPADLARASTFIQYASLVDDRYKGLWGASSLP